jgi:hypothetical protein
MSNRELTWKDKFKLNIFASLITLLAKIWFGTVRVKIINQEVYDKYFKGARSGHVVAGSWHRHSIFLFYFFHNLGSRNNLNHHLLSKRSWPPLISDLEPQSRPPRASNFSLCRNLVPFRRRCRNHQTFAKGHLRAMQMKTGFGFGTGHFSRINQQRLTAIEQIANDRMTRISQVNAKLIHVIIGVGVKLSKK